MLTTNGCVHLGTDLFNHSKGLFSNRALDMLSECQYNCPSMFKSSRKKGWWRGRRDGGEGEERGLRKGAEREKREKRQKGIELTISRGG